MTLNKYKKIVIWLLPIALLMLQKALQYLNIGELFILVVVIGVVIQMSRKIYPLLSTAIPLRVRLKIAIKEVLKIGLLIYIFGLISSISPYLPIIISIFRNIIRDESKDIVDEIDFLTKEESDVTPALIENKANPTITPTPTYSVESDNYPMTSISTNVRPASQEPVDAYGYPEYSIRWEVHPLKEVIEVGTQSLIKSRHIPARDITQVDAIDQYLSELRNIDPDKSLVVDCSSQPIEKTKELQTLLEVTHYCNNSELDTTDILLGHHYVGQPETARDFSHPILPLNGDLTDFELTEEQNSIITSFSYQGEIDDNLVGEVMIPEVDDTSYEWVRELFEQYE